MYRYCPNAGIPDAVPPGVRQQYPQHGIPERRVVEEDEARRAAADAKFRACPLRSFIASTLATASSPAAFLASATASASVARGPFGLGRAQGTARASVAFLSLRAARISCDAPSFLLTSFSMKARLFTESRVWGCFVPSVVSLGPC